MSGLMSMNLWVKRSAPCAFCRRSSDFTHFSSKLMAACLYVSRCTCAYFSANIDAVSVESEPPENITVTCAVGSGSPKVVRGAGAGSSRTAPFPGLEVAIDEGSKGLDTEIHLLFSVVIAERHAYGRGNLVAMVVMVGAQATGAHLDPTGHVQQLGQAHRILAVDMEVHDARVVVGAT